MNIEFDVVEDGQLQNGAVVYRNHEFSFDVEPAPIRGFTSFLVNDLSLEVDDEGVLLSVWGLCPHPGWDKGIVQLPKVTRGSVKIRADSPLSRGISVSINGSSRWPVLYDKDSGWLVVGNPKEADIFIEFVSGAILGLDERGGLGALWLKAITGL